MSTSFFVVTCPCGEAEFPVDPGKVPDDGVYARCSECSTVFRVERPRHSGAQQRREADTPAVGSAPAAAAVLDGTSAESFDAYFEPVYPTEGEGGLDTVVEDHGALQGEPAAAAPPPPAPEPEVGFRMEVDLPSPPSGASPFGRRDPHEKARRLARVLVSDMVTYNRERHARALAAGTLPEDFDEEIRKSWDEYTQQVGRELAEQTTYFRDALNDILAGGRAGGPDLF
jgi:predicted Zn finger-like uncharacterized protein